MTSRQAHRGTPEHVVLGEAVDHLADVFGAKVSNRRATETHGQNTGDVDGDSTQLRVAFEVLLKSLGVTSRMRLRLPSDLDIESRVHYLAKHAGVSCRKVRLEAGWWKHDPGHLLAFLGDGTPVALVSSFLGVPRVYNAGTRVSTSLDAKTAQQIDSSAFVLLPTFPDDGRGIRMLLRLWLARPNVADLLLALLLGMGAAALSTLVPYFSGLLFVSVVPELDRAQFLYVAFAILGIAFSVAVFRLSRIAALTRTRGRLDATTQSALLDRLARLPVPFFGRHGAGDLADRALGLSDLLRGVSGVTLDFLYGVVFCVFYVGFLFAHSWPVGLFALAFVVLSAAVMTVGHGLVYRSRKVFAERSGQLSNLVFHLIGGVTKLRAAGAEARAFLRWAEALAQARTVALRASLTSSATSVLCSAATSAALVGFYAAVMHAMRSPTQQPSVGAFVAMTVALGGLQIAVSELCASLSSISEMLPRLHRVLPLLSHPPERRQVNAQLPLLRGDLVLRGVGFRYERDAPLVLCDINIHAQPGAFVAIVGPTGSGKSTLLKILLGFLQPTHGEVLIDGVDLRNADLRGVREQMGVVLQTSALVAGSIYDNIAAASGCNVEQAWHAARAAAIAEDIEQLPMGMFTPVSEWGGNFSGGQRQRILIARCLSKKPRVLILDEATSALDNRTQAQVMRGLQRQCLTRIVVAHRLSTIQSADCIYVLDEGRVVQKGTCAQLMQREGVFRRIAGKQLMWEDRVRASDWKESPGDAPTRSEALSAANEQ